MDEMTFEEYDLSVKANLSRPLQDYPPVVGRAALRFIGEGRDEDAVELLKIFDRMILALGLAGESGEVCDLIKKKYGHAKPVEDSKIELELGDTKFYGSALALSFGSTSARIAQMNAAKLKKRFPNGFNAIDANAKADESEELDPKTGLPAWFRPNLAEEI